MISEGELLQMEARAEAATETRYAEVTRSDVPRLIAGYRAMEKDLHQTEAELKFWVAESKEWASGCEKAEAERDTLQRKMQIVMSALVEYARMPAGLSKIAYKAIAEISENVPEAEDRKTLEVDELRREVEALRRVAGAAESVQIDGPRKPWVDLGRALAAWRKEHK